MSNTTTIVRGFKLTRRDATVLAFTDCDIDLVVDGVTYLASAALTPSEAVQALGLAVDDQEVQGALSSAAISETDLAAGLYDGATVEVLEIDWSTQARHATVGLYFLGEVSRTESAFSAELRSEAGNLAQVRGRYVTAICDAELGDTRCGLSTSGLIISGAITAVTGDTEFLVSGLTATSAEGLYSRGSIEWTSGANLGQVQEVRIHRGKILGLWRPPIYAVSVGDDFDISPGCDKAFLTCRDRFFNTDNFRGFPAVVGDDAFSYAVPGESDLDGGATNAF
jgi:uncharacterized phage protein (TIGR02218 family)